VVRKGGGKHKTPTLVLWVLHASCAVAGEAGGACVEKYVSVCEREWMSERERGEEEETIDARMSTSDWGYGRKGGEGGGSDFEQKNHEDEGLGFRVWGKVKKFCMKSCCTYDVHLNESWCTCE